MADDFEKSVDALVHALSVKRPETDRLAQFLYDMKLHMSYTTKVDNAFKDLAKSKSSLSNEGRTDFFTWLEGLDMVSAFEKISSDIGKLGFTPVQSIMSEYFHVFDRWKKGDRAQDIYPKDNKDKQ